VSFHYLHVKKHARKSNNNNKRRRENEDQMDEIKER
jgi:hypothetical protein